MKTSNGIIFTLVTLCSLLLNEAVSSTSDLGVGYDKKQDDAVLKLMDAIEAMKTKKRMKRLKEVLREKQQRLRDDLNDGILPQMKTKFDSMQNTNVLQSKEEMIENIERMKKMAKLHKGKNLGYGPLM